MATVAKGENRNDSRKSQPQPNKEGGGERNKQQGNAPNTKKSAYWQHCLDWSFAT